MYLACETTQDSSPRTAAPELKQLPQAPTNLPTTRRISVASIRGGRESQQTRHFTTHPASLNRPAQPNSGPIALK
ncbi:hypothetical protein K466DRAFT_607729 [Polyporus arcularius HHB13444]|uniref:Uncharacterized protein n=1 Tax=Polyporus arcularius HHB13444 TaxID=1314778 RepID=A0A5C3NJV6_9APHY|nr:hypothetical protein K466DRAFT_607729 [Polyporus arcularius HHB13444]